MSDVADHPRNRSNGTASQDGEWPQAHRRIDATQGAIRRSREMIEESMRILADSHKILPPLR